MLRLAFLTVGDPTRLTGGYLYHRQVFLRLRNRGVQIDEIVASGATLAEQLAASADFVAGFDPTPYNVIVVDALARAVCGPGLDAWRAQRPLVAMVHELPSVAEPADPAERLREAPLVRADRLIAVSDDGARILVERGVDPGRIVIASGGFDRLPLPSHPRPAPAHQSTALTVAQWIPRKGLLELAQAWAVAARPGWQLELIGEDQADTAYAARVRAVLATAPAGSVQVRGPVSDRGLREALGRAALFVLPSHYEGYGIAYAEALAYGLPVVACAVGPVPALVGTRAGILVPPGDVPALTAALSRLMDDAALRADMSAAALARAANLPTWDETAAGFLRAVSINR